MADGEEDKLDWSKVEETVAQQMKYNLNDVKLAELYGKKAQEKFHLGKWAEPADPTEKQFLDYCRACIQKADSRIISVKVVIVSPIDSWQFQITLNDGFQMKSAISSELVYSASQMSAFHLQGVAERLADDVKHYLKQEHPFKPTKIENKHFGIPDEAITSNEEWQSILQAAQKSILEQHLYPPPNLIGPSASGKTLTQLQQFKSQPPTPPAEDKKFKTGPELEYNKSLDLLKNQSVSYGALTDVGNTWGSLKEEIWAAKKLLQAKKLPLQQNKVYAPTKLYKGFDGQRVQDNLREVLPCLYEQVRCPACGTKQVMSSTIIHLNDEHDWTREAIADWAESLDIDISVKEKDNE